VSPWVRVTISTSTSACCGDFMNAARIGIGGALDGVRPQAVVCSSARLESARMLSDRSAAKDRTSCTKA
jgi:hypothetical protein